MSTSTGVESEIFRQDISRRLHVPRPLGTPPRFGIQLPPGIPPLFGILRRPGIPLLRILVAAGYTLVAGGITAKAQLALGVEWHPAVAFTDNEVNLKEHKDRGGRRLENTIGETVCVLCG
jgi:hypothetical protein